MIEATLLPFAVGFPAGICAGLFGIGGGIFLMPALAAAGYPYASAVATVALPVLFSALLALWRRRTRPSGAHAAAAVASSLPAAFAGAHFIQTADATQTRLLFTAFVVLLLCLSIDVMRPQRPSSLATQNRSPLWMLLLGALAGTCSGLFGIGGGFLLIPTLMRFYGMSIERAGATAQVQIVAASMVTLLTHRSVGMVDLRESLWLGVAVIPGVLLGLRLAQRLPQLVLRKLLGALMLSVALYTVLKQGLVF